jgi:hypothetical protein
MTAKLIITNTDARDKQNITVDCLLFSLIPLLMPSMKHRMPESKYIAEAKIATVNNEPTTRKTHRATIKAQ